MSENKKTEKGLELNIRSFLVSIGVIFLLMVLCYLMTFWIPGGQYDRVLNADGNYVVDTAGEFRTVEGGLPFWKWLLSPVLVLGSSGSGMLLAVLAFLLVIGGAFNGLEKCGVMRYMLDRLTEKYGASRYRLMAVLILFFMSMGSLIGSFEECVPLVPIVTSLSVALGWDIVTGIAMSLLAVGCGFAAGVFNPFTVGIAQRLSGLPMFSGASLRAVAFVLIYFLLLFFVRGHAKKVEREVSYQTVSYEKDPKKGRALITFASILGAGILIVFLSGFITVLQDYTMIIVAVMFLVAGIASVLISGFGVKNLIKSFGQGVVSMLPAVLMILMASSIKYILEESHILDSVLHFSIGIAKTLPSEMTVLFLYLLVLVMNFFVASGSAKAFMLIPLIVPLASAVGVSSQLCIMAYAFGDGFSNVFYPTNAALLISLSLAGVSYGKWVRWSWKFQLANFVLTSGILLLGFVLGY